MGSARVDPVPSIDFFDEEVAPFDEDGGARDVFDDKFGGYEEEAADVALDVARDERF